MAAEVLIPMGTFAAYAATDLASGDLIRWYTTEQEVTKCGNGARPVGVCITAVTAGDLVNYEGAVEFFKTAGIVKVPVDYTPTVGAEVESGATGRIQAYTSGYAFGQVLAVTVEDETTYAELYIY